MTLLEGGKRKAEGGKADLDSATAGVWVRWGMLLGFVAMLSVLPILGHGCHRGDHDFEPSAVPLNPCALPADLPR